MSQEPPEDKKHKRKRDSRVLVQVQCKGYRCMAYRDENGVWIDFHSGKPIEGEVHEVSDSAD